MPFFLLIYVIKTKVIGHNGGFWGDKLIVYKNKG